MSTMSAAAALTEMIAVVEKISLTDLARLAAHEYDDDAAHEYDDDAAVPPEGSPGAAFLRDAQLVYVDWVREHGRFPATDAEIDETVAQWVDAESTPAQHAQAFVDLGLYFSHHANVCDGAAPWQLRKALDSAAEQLAVTLTQEYGPLV